MIKKSSNGQSPTSSKEIMWSGAKLIFEGDIGIWNISIWKKSSLITHIMHRIASTLIIYRCTRYWPVTRLVHFKTHVLLLLAGALKANGFFPLLRMLGIYHRLRRHLRRRICPTSRPVSSPGCCPFRTGGNLRVDIFFYCDSSTRVSEASEARTWAEVLLACIFADLPQTHLTWCWRGWTDGQTDRTMAIG